MNQVLCSVNDKDCTGKIHQHHDDYAHMDATRPLCSYHHRRWHAVNGRAENWDMGPRFPVTARLPREAADALAAIGKKEERRAGNLLTVLILFFLENPALQECVLTRWGMFESDHAGDAKRKAQAALTSAAREWFAADREKAEVAA